MRECVSVSARRPTATALAAFMKSAVTKEMLSPH